jgi:polyhydroxyalkanoate synthesis regulator phasin
MKFRKLFIFTLILILALQSKVFAQIPSENISKPKCDHQCKHNFHFTHSSIRILKNKYNVKAEEIEKAKAEEKTIFDIAKSKGLTETKLKELIIAPKLKALDEMINTGEMNKENGEALKVKLKEEIKNWNGKIEHMKPDIKPSVNIEETTSRDSDADKDTDDQED